MADSPEPMNVDRPASGLGPGRVGQRVVVRRVVPGETGPTGGPAMTDVLGVMQSWHDGLTTIRREDGTSVEIAIRHIVAGKPVPPRPSRFSRLSDDEVESRVSGLFVPRETRRIGDWILRVTGGTNFRPNSLLPIGQPGIELDDAIKRAADFYTSRGHQPCAQVVVDSPIQRDLEARGWTRAPAKESDVLLAGVAQLARTIPTIDVSAVTHHDSISREWLVGNEAALANYVAVEESLRLQDAVFASIHEGAGQVARGRINLVNDWALFADLTVQPENRRRGLARAIMADATEWAAEQGASVMALQVSCDNEPAQRLYESLGFQRHHSYCYLTLPDSS